MIFPCFSGDVKNGLYLFSALKTKGLILHVWEEKRLNDARRFHWRILSQEFSPILTIIMKQKYAYDLETERPVSVLCHTSKVS